MKKITMKVLMLLGVVVLLGLAFTSCDDDDKPAITKSSLLGKWALEKTVINEVIEKPTSECKTKKDYLEILDNGKSNSISHSMECVVADIDEYQWTLNGDIFQVGDESDTEIHKIKSLTETSMVLELIKTIKNGKEVIQDANGDGKQDKFLMYLVKIK